MTSGLFQLILLIWLVWATPTVVSYLVFYENVSNQVYDISTDSIGLPLFVNLGVTIISAVYQTVIVSLASRRVGIVVRLSLMVPSCIVGLLGTAYWALPNHLFISCAFFMTVLFSIGIAAKGIANDA